jgi:hypothetical protein
MIKETAAFVIMETGAGGRLALRHAAASFNVPRALWIGIAHLEGINSISIKEVIPDNDGTENITYK